MTTDPWQEAVCAWVSAQSNGDGDAGSSDDSDAEDDGASLESWRAEPAWPWSLSEQNSPLVLWKRRPCLVWRPGTCNIGAPRG